ncbi:MAG: cysteine peptidase family C39 domain-containing protein [Candidatus Limnocylindrus sp.]
MRCVAAAGIGLVLLLGGSAARAQPEHALEVRQIGHGCGATCVAVYARRVSDSRITFSEAQRATDPDGDGVCSIADLQRALRSLGLEVDAYERPSRSLPRVPAILWVSSSVQGNAPYDHFIVTEPAARGRFVVHFPPFGTSLQSERDIGAIWSGRYVATTSVHRGWWMPWLIVGTVAVLLIVGLLGRLRGGACRSSA